MANVQKKPKVILFDIGGVCVVSPLGAILKYEKEHNIPIGYINFAISASKPNGSWHRAERGELPLDDAWFRAFKADLERPSTWEQFHRNKAKAKSTTRTPNTATNPTPSIPSINAEELFWTMMSASRHPDPYMAPALKKLKANNTLGGKHPHIAALSNTTIFPANHPFNTPQPGDIRQNFSIFISSAHVGMRKPDRNIYEHAMKLLREKWPHDNIQPHDILFLDDIGENLRTGKQMGWRTLKVLLGSTDEAVRELERVTGLDLLEDNKAKL